jgi:glycosyltransferase involved in cell wall biosynthesis
MRKQPSQYFAQNGKLMSVSKKSILLVGHASNTYIHGAELSLIDNLKSLVALGRRVVVIIPNEKNSEYISRIREFTQEIYFVHIPWNIANNKADSDIIEKIVEIANITNAEMIFSNTITMREPLIAAQRMSIPSVCVVREVPAQNSSLSIMLEKDLKQVVSEIHSLSDFIIANSKYTLNVFHLNGKSAIVRNTFNADLLKAIKVRNKTFTIGIVGSLNQEKGFADFISIARHFESKENLSFLAFGDITSAFMSQYEDDFPKNVELKGYESDHAKIYPNLDLVLQLSSLNESFSRVTLESMASAVPVIAYNVGAVAELFNNGVTGYLVVPGDLDEVIRLISYLSQDSEAARSMGESARSFAISNFSQELQIQDLKRVLTAVTVNHENALHFSTDISIPVSEINRSHFKDPFLVENRSRFATATGVKFVSDNQFVVASLLGQQLHLYEFDSKNRTGALLSTIDSHNGNILVSLDAIDFNGKDLIIGSDCEFSSMSTYRVSNQSLEYLETIPVGNSPTNYIHGAIFATSDSKVVAACITAGNKGIAFYNRLTKKMIGHFSTGDWGVKDMAMLALDSDRFIAVCTKSNVGQDLKTEHAVNLLIVQTSKWLFRFRRFKVISEFLIPDESIETIQIRGDYIFMACQSADSIIVMRHENGTLYKVDELQGFSFPHGVDISPDGKWMAVANYGTSSINIRENRFPVAAR